MQKYSHIIWDWNGTLLDDTQACVNSVNKMLADRNLAVLTVEQYRDTFGFPVSDFYDKIGFKLGNEDWDAMAVEFHDLLLSDDSVSLHSDSKCVLTALRKRGFIQSVLSASKQSILDSMLSDYELMDYFKWVRGINNLYGDSKMSMGRELVQEMGVSPEDIVIIGDSLHDHEVAEDLNINCLLVACGHQSYERLAQTGVKVFHSLSEVVDII